MPVRYQAALRPDDQNSQLRNWGVIVPNIVNFLSKVQLPFNRVSISLSVGDLIGASLSRKQVGRSRKYWPCLLTVPPCGMKAMHCY